MAIISQIITGLSLTVPPASSSQVPSSSKHLCIIKTSFLNGGGYRRVAKASCAKKAQPKYNLSLIHLCGPPRRVYYTHKQPTFMVSLFILMFSSKICVLIAAGAFRIMHVKIAPSSQSQCSRQRGGTLGTRMNLFDRFARVVKSYANAVVSSLEDPEKVLEQTVIEMNDDLIKMRQSTAQVLASQKRLENKYKAAQQASEDWYRKAQLALEKGDEDLAREALKRRKSNADSATSLKAQFDQQKTVVESLVSNTRLLESKIQEAKSKKDTLKARAQSAKTATKVNEMLGSVNTSSALGAFEKMEEKVLAMESQAEALGELTTDNLEGQFALLESSSVDNDLANLKKELSGSSKKGELPPGRTTVSGTSTRSPFQDSEIEKELNKLRQKAKDF